MIKILSLLLILMITGVTATEALTTPPKYKRRKIHRQNSVDNTNRRAKNAQRKNGLGFLQTTIWKEVRYV